MSYIHCGNFVKGSSSVGFSSHYHIKHVKQGVPSKTSPISNQIIQVALYAQWKCRPSINSSNTDISTIPEVYDYNSKASHSAKMLTKDMKIRLSIQVKITSPINGLL